MRRHFREKIWVVRSGDGRTVADIVRRAGEDPVAIDEGRVFVGKKRAMRAEQPVTTGDAVRIGPGRPLMSNRDAPKVAILFHEDDLVACAKPAGLPTVPDHAGSVHALVAIVARLLGVNTEVLRVTSRLDRDVSGVVVFALAPAAEQRLQKARAEGRYQRRYIALALTDTRTIALGGEGVWDAPIGRAPDPRLRAVGGPDAKAAMTRWRAIARATSEGRATNASPQASAVMLAVDPITGRTHQIRIHASNAGAPLIGDRAYGGTTRIALPNGRVLAPSRIALHAARVIVPGAAGQIEACAPIPAELVETWSALGGDADAWERALTSGAQQGGGSGQLAASDLSRS